MEKFTLPKGYLSASAISTLLRCQKQYEFRYIHDIIAPPSVALLLGSATHATFEDYFEDYLATKVRKPSKNVADISVAKLEEEITKRDFKLTGSEFDSAVYEIRGLTTAYIDNVGVTIEPASVEDEFRYVTEHGIEILGYIDLKNHLGIGTPAEKLGIIDYKITGKKWNKAKLENSLQFHLYTMSTGITDIEIHNLVKGSKSKTLPKKPPVDGVLDITSNIRVISHTFDDSEHDHFSELVLQCARQITSGIFLPCDPESWCCNESWCGYWHLCRGKNKTSSDIFDMHRESDIGADCFETDLAH